MNIDIRFLIRRTLMGLKYLRYFPQMLPAIFFYLFLLGNRKKLLLEDLDAFYRVEYQRKRLSDITAFYRLMVEYNAFRNVFYYRLKPFHNMICWFMPSCKTLALRSLKIGGGIYSTWHFVANWWCEYWQKFFHQSECNYWMARSRLSYNRR